jgi:ATP-dependent DNA helicase RecG
MPEHQEIEWKESWRDDYLKWLCGYANAHGGTLFIGKDDDGNVVGIRGSKKLLEDLPNKITNAMGIIADVNLHTENGKEFIEIVVDKYPFLISYHGQYYYRSGSVLREIVGKELERALLKSQGKTWDGVSLPKLSVADLKPEAIALFKQKALARGRLIAEEATVSNDVLMENLHLVDEDGSLIRAAMLAFYRDPERWVTGAYIKIGFFGDSDSDLQYQDEIHGPLIEQIDRTIDLVYTKYMKARITYEGIQRVEVFMFPREAFREILLNAVVHKDYSSCNPIQISIYEDHMYIWNDGQMPANLRTTESLFAKHSSKPFNPKLAHVLFISGMIEAWGRGFDKIKTACDALYHTPIPDYEMSGDGIMVHCHANEKYLQLAMENRLGVDETILSRFRDAERMDVIRIMELCDTSKRFTSAEVQAILGKPKPTVARLLKKICDTGLLKMVGSGRATKYQKSSQNHETI